MSAKFLYSLSDERPDLQKQIGCMNGFFQLFDRHHFLSGRRITGQNHKRLPPGQSGNHGTEPTNTLQKYTEKNLKKAVKEKQRISTESSQTSFSSSSCSSSFSSIDCNRTSQLEPPSFSQTISPQTPTRASPMYQSNASLQSSRQSLDLRNVVKDSIYRDACGLSVKPATKEEAGGQTFKHMDSPRPLQQPKSVKGRGPGHNESFRVLAKLREAPWNSKEGKEGSLALAPKDTPRFSYDGRESRDALKSTIKLKELPRLSLDSRECSMRSSLTEMKSNYLLGDLKSGNRNSNIISNQQQELGSQKRSSSVVAKLMGLEAYPDSVSIKGNQTEQIKSCADVVCDPFSRSLRITDENKQNRIFGSPRYSHKEPISPRLRNADSVKKPTANSKFPIEPAPWRQADGSRGPQKPAVKGQETPKGPNSSLSVYGEIEKRLAELEFKKSGKDLRALKQILAAMQKNKEMSETRKEDQASNFVSQTSNDRSLDQSSKLANPKNLLSNSSIFPTIKGASSPKSLKSPIMIMKPAKLLEKGSNTVAPIPTDSIAGLRRLQTGGSADNRKESINKQTAKDLTTRTNHLRELSSRPFHPMDKNTGTRTSRSIPMSKDIRPITGEDINSGKSSGTLSPRLQQKKLGLQKQSRPTTPSSDSSRTRRQPNSRQPIELGSQYRLPRPKSPTLQPSDDELSEISSEVRELSHQGDTISLQSESNSSLASHVDTEATSTYRSDKINGTFFQQHGQKQKNPGARFIEDKSMVESARAALEQPSPISVLDASFDRDESPSPVKKISNAFKDDEASNSDEAEWNPKVMNHLSNCSKPNLNPESDHREVENIQRLIQNLMQMDYAHEETIYNSTIPDHRYILEMMLASGLLRDLESGISAIELHPSGHLINPKLFLALEQTKASTNDKNNGEKIANSKPIENIQRKLLFDTVNEILFRKLVLEDSSTQWHSPSKLAGKRPKGQQLLKDLCSEVDHLQANNSNCSTDAEDDILRSISYQSINWSDCQSEISGLVLDVERLIFKDLINEIVNGEAAGLRGRPGGHRRQLFPK